MSNVNIKRIGTHQDPLWIEQSDYIARVKITAEVWSDDYDYEQVYLKHVSADKYVLCCVPAYFYDYNIGDIVSVDEDSVVTKLLKWGGHYNYRVAFDEKKGLEFENHVLDTIEEMGVGVECFNSIYFGLDTDSIEVSKKLVDYLTELENSKQILAFENVIQKKKPWFKWF